MAEAEGWMRGDATAFAKAANLYGSLDLPYEEARCRLEAGELREILRTYGLQNGPLGARLRELEPAGS